MMSSRKKNANPFTLFSFQDIITSVMGIILLSALLLAVELTRRTISSPSAAVHVAVDAIEASLQTAQDDTAELQKQFDALTEDAQRVAETTIPELPQREAVASEQVRRLQAELASLIQAVSSRRKERDRVQAQLFDRRDDVKQLEELEQENAQSEAELTALTASKRMLFNAAPGTAKTPWVIDYSETKLLVGPLPKPETASTSPLEFSSASKLLDYCDSLSPTNDYFLLMIRPSGAHSYDAVVDKLRSRGFDLGFDLLGEDQEVFPGFQAP